MTSTIKTARIAGIMLGVICAIASATAAQASVQVSGGPFHDLLACPRVSDRVLSRLRGRYVGFGQVVYFGVQMETVWKTAGGDMLTSALNFNIQLGDHQPKVNYSVNTSIDSHPANGGHQPTQSGGPSAFLPTQGVAQVIQVYSDGNSAVNNLTVDVTNQNLGNGHSPLSGNNSNHSTTSSNGALASATINPSGISTEITIPGQGQARQIITSNGLAAAVSQSILLAGSYNQIQNSMMLTLGVRSGGVGNEGGAIPLNTVLGTTMGLPRLVN